MATKYPWKTDDETSVFWKPIDIKGKRWNQMFPYRLLVIDITKPHEIVGGGSIGNKEASSFITETGKGEVRITQQLLTSNVWEYRLPITPQQLQITDQYAINTTATMRGIVEEHNSLKFKMITASGTTGIWPKRPAIGGAPKALNSLQSIFSGTINKFNGLASGVQGTLDQAIQGDHPQKPSVAKAPEDDDLQQTGYFQAMLLGQFIERYVEEKKKYDRKDWRLVFDMPKQNKAFIVTPENFTLKQSAQKPNEYLWAFQLKAWKRIDLLSPKSIATKIPDVLDTNTYQKMLSTLSAVRKNIGDATDLIKAVRSDFQKPLNILRQTALIIKDLGGFFFTVADFPENLILDISSSVTESIFIAKNSFKREPVSKGPPVRSSLSVPPPFAIKGNTASIKAGAAVNNIVATTIANEGLSEQAVKDGALGEEAAQNSESSSSKELFESPNENFELFNGISMDSLKLSTPQQDAVQTELESIRLINVDQLRSFKEEIQSLISEISNNFGAADPTIAAVYGLPAPKERVTPMSIEENEILISLMEVIQIFDELTATKKFDDKKDSSPLEFVGGLANESGIDFTVTENKFLVPVPFGMTIEAISARYLKDPDKFIEIASLNGLRSPYIDEDGFTYDLLSNADGRRFNITNEDDNLYIGQKITLSSNTVPSFIRKIISIDKISEGNYLITVDGVSDLGILKTTDNSYMQGYLPGTVNSQNQIYIPTAAPAPEDDRTQAISHLDEPALTKLSKVDFLLTEANDVALNSVGDFRLANGMTNLIQSLKLKINTKKGSLLRHLDYGLGLKHGASIADVNSGAIISELNKMISDDPRFDSIKRLDIVLNGPTLNISMEVTITNQNGVVPINFSIEQ